VRKAAIHEREAEQSYEAATVAGVVATVLAAFLWAMITADVGAPIGWMAMGMGFVVGLAVRVAGRGIDPEFGVIGATLSLLGCVLGNVLAASAMIAAQQGTPVTEVVSALDLVITADLLIAWFRPIDLMYYGVAAFAGYQTSFRRLPETQVR